jgi:hypothetical protein
MPYIMKKYYVYKLENSDGEFYFGSRGCNCDPYDDKYLGSPKIWKPQKNLLVKTILRIFDNRRECIMFERDLILKNINDKSNRNYGIPHPNITRENLISAVDKKGNTLTICKEDPLFGIEYFGVTKGRVPVRDDDGRVIMVDLNDPRYVSGELKSANHNLTPKGKDHQNYEKNWINDGISQRLIPKESPIPQGWKKGTLQKGLTTNSSHVGKCWIHNKELNKTKRIEKSDLDFYLSNGWDKNRLKLGKYAKRKKV